MTSVRKYSYKGALILEMTDGTFNAESEGMIIGKRFPSKEAAMKAVDRFIQGWKQSLGYQNGKVSKFKNTAFQNGVAKAQEYINSKLVNAIDPSAPYIAFPSPNGTNWFVGQGWKSPPGNSTGVSYKTQAEAVQAARKKNEARQATRDHEDWLDQHHQKLARGDYRTYRNTGKAGDL